MKTRARTRNKNKAKTWDVVIGTGFGAGFWPWGPGTAGAALATLLWCCYAFPIHGVLPKAPTLAYWYVNDVTILLVILFTVISIKPIDRLEKAWDEDPSRVVVDEMVGVWITLLAVPETMEWWWIAAGFALFRLFDIWKPLGVRWIDRNVKGGLGVMMDDVLAGVYGALTLWGITSVVA